MIKIFCLAILFVFGSGSVLASEETPLEKIATRSREIERQNQLTPHDPRHQEASKLSRLSRFSVYTVGLGIKPFRDLSELTPDPCSICLEDMDSNTLSTKLPCGHTWHSSCLINTILNTPDGIYKCPAADCRAEFSVSDHILRGEDDLLKVAKAYIQNSQTLRFCPVGDACGLVLTYKITHPDKRLLWTQTCPHCKTVSCPKCSIRHDSKTCEEQRAEYLGRYTEFSDAQVQEWFENPNYFRCECGCIHYKANGCDTMVCGGDTHGGQIQLGGCGATLQFETGRANLIQHIESLRRSAAAAENPSETQNLVPHTPAPDPSETQNLVPHTPAPPRSLIRQWLQYFGIL